MAQLKKYKVAIKLIILFIFITLFISLVFYFSPATVAGN